MKKKEKTLNYVLSIGFILLIVIFLTSLISISRYVLSDGNIIQEHVASTKDLLENIEKVELSVENQDGVPIRTISINRNQRITNFDENIFETTYLNINDNKSLITLILNQEIKELNNVLYLEYSNISEVEKNDIVLYNVKEIGLVLTIDENAQDNGITIFNFDSTDNDKIEFGNILGKVIYEGKEEDN